MEIPATLYDFYTFSGYRPQRAVEPDKRGVGIGVTLVRHRIPQKDSAAHAAGLRGSFTTLAGVASGIFRAAISQSGWCFRFPALSVCGAAA
jgi:hypothetical protein